MAKKHHPRRGSLQFWPRKRAKKAFARVRSWSKIANTPICGFIGYKAGMTHIIAKDNSPHSIYKKELLSIPVTIIECPPLKPLSLRFYQTSPDGLQCIAEIFSKNTSKDIKKILKLPKKPAKIPEQFDEVRLAVHSQPKLTGIGQKKPEIIELPIKGKNPKERLEQAQSFLEREIKLQDVLKDQKLVDVHSITKGKGFQGAVKRFGVKIRTRKSEKTKRGTGNLGAWTPKKVLFSVPQPGKMGFHQRTEYNKLNIMIDSAPEKVNPKAGFLHYGLIKNDYIMLKGSIPGPVKRTIVLTPSMRQRKPGELQVVSISKESKQ